MAQVTIMMIHLVEAVLLRKHSFCVKNLPTAPDNDGNEDDDDHDAMTTMMTMRTMVTWDKSPYHPPPL